MTRKEIKAKARADLGNDIFSDKWLYALLTIGLVSVFSFIASATGIGTLLLVIFGGTISYGILKVFINIAKGREQKARMEHLFDGFKTNLSNTVIVGLLSELFTFLWSLLFIIPGIVKSYSYSMAVYLMEDDDNLSGIDAITKSRQMMNGHKWDLFVLDLSFIGWYIVGTICFGIGIFWVLPYHQLARVNFFEEVSKEPLVVDVK